MAEQSAAPIEKVCVVCGKDVAKLPRVKDAAGHYICVGTCQETIKAKAAAARPVIGKPVPPPVIRKPEPDSYDMMEKLIAESPMTRARHCTGCGNPLVNNAVVCVRCGMNAMTGKSMKTRVQINKEKTKAEKAASAALSQTAFFISPFAIAMYVILGMGAIGTAGAMNVAFTVPALAMMGIGYLVALIWGIIDAYKEGETTMGSFMVCHLIGGFLPGILRISGLIGFFVTIYYIVIETENGYLKAVYFGTALALIAFIATIFMTEGEAFRDLMDKANFQSSSEPEYE